MSSTETISELFNRDPEKLTDQDIDKIVEHLREGRAKYVAGDKTAGNKKATGKKAAAAADAPTIDLGELGL